MRTTIKSIRRYGTRWTVTLACGHSLTATADQAKADQLYVGKPMTCAETHQEKNQ